MQKCSAVGLICLLLVTGAGFADNGVEQWELVYAPEFGSSIARTMKLELLDVTLQGSSMGFAGEGSARVGVRFDEPPAGGTGTKLTVTFTDIKGAMPGEEVALPGPLVVTLTVNERARLASYKVGQNTASPTLSLGIYAVAGLTVFSMLPPLPEGPVTIGEEWDWQQVINFPDAQQATVNLHCRLVSCEGGQVVIESSGQVTLPQMKAPNPLFPDQQMTVTNAKAVVSKLRQTCDLMSLVVLHTEGEAQVSFEGVGPDYTLPLGAQMKMKLTPPAPLPPAPPG